MQFKKNNIQRFCKSKKSAPYKRYIYYLTKDGFKEKSRLVKEYLDCSLNFFKQAKNAYLKILIEIKEKKTFRGSCRRGRFSGYMQTITFLQENLKILDHLKVDSNKKIKINSKKIRSKLNDIAFYNS